MIEKAGEIIAIDQVFHDGSLSGNGREDSPLGLTLSAGNWISLSSSNKTINWKKLDGKGIKFNTEQPVLSAGSVYDIDTTVVITNTNGKPDYNEYLLTIDDTKYHFNHDMSNPVSSVYTFNTIFRCDETTKLKTNLSAKNKDTATYSIYQNIHDIVTIVGNVEDVWTRLRVNAPITGTGKEVAPLGLDNIWLNDVNNTVASANIWNTTTDQVNTSALLWNTNVEKLNESADIWNKITEQFNTSASIWNVISNSFNTSSVLWNNALEKLNASADIWNTTTETLSSNSSIWVETINDILTSAVKWNTIPELPDMSGNLVINNKTWTELSALSNTILGSGLSASHTGASATIDAFIETSLENGILNFINSNFNK